MSLWAVDMSIWHDIVHISLSFSYPYEISSVKLAISLPFSKFQNPVPVFASSWNLSNFFASVPETCSCFKCQQPKRENNKKNKFSSLCALASQLSVFERTIFSIHTQKLRFAKCVLTAMCAFQCQKQETKFLPHLSFFRVHIFHIDPLSSQHTAAQHAHEQWVLADLSVRDWGAQWWLLLAIETKVVSIIKYYTYYTNNNYKCIYIYINSFTTGIALPRKEGSSLHLLCEYETLCWVNASLWQQFQNTVWEVSTLFIFTSRLDEMSPLARAFDLHERLLSYSNGGPLNPFFPGSTQFFTKFAGLRCSSFKSQMQARWWDIDRRSTLAPGQHVSWEWRFTFPPSVGG